MRKYIVILGFMVMTGCGGGSGSSSGSNDGIDQVLAVLNSGTGVLLEGIGNAVNLDSNRISSVRGCDTNSSIPRSAVEDILISTSSNGFCVGSAQDKECFAANENTVTIHFSDPANAKMLTVIPNSSYRVEINFSPSAFETVIMRPNSNCDIDQIDLSQQQVDGTYSGKIYSYNESVNSTNGVADISQEFSLTCTNNLCAENALIDTFGTGLDFTADSNETALDEFRLASTGINYNFYGRTSSDGKILVGVGVPENGVCGVDCIFMVLSK